MIGDAGDYMNKPSRTIIFPNIDSETEALLMEIAARNSNHHLMISEKERRTGFFECETIADSIQIHDDFIRSKGTNCRYANYRMFVQITSDVNAHDYNTHKTIITHKLRECLPDINIMYFKLFQINDRLTGNGYIVIDKHDHLRLLVRKNFACERDESATTPPTTFQLRNYVKKKNHVPVGANV